jgi:HPt (histidine-containing phosphotransfer) domain-containing protein
MDLKSENSAESICRYLIDEFELDETDVTEMFEEFFKNIEELAETAVEQLNSGLSWENLRMTAHSMKGAAGNMGATAIFKLAKAMEQATISQDREEFLRFRELLLENLENLKAQVDEQN